MLTTSAAFANGNLAAGLIQSLQYILTSVAADYNAFESRTGNVKSQDINAIYQDVLGRDATPNEVAAAENALYANTGSLSSIRAALTQSLAAQAEIQTIYQYAYGGAQPDAQTLADDELALQTETSDDVQAQTLHDADPTSNFFILADYRPDPGGIDFSFIIEHEGNRNDAYVPKGLDGTPDPGSGVTIGAGCDIGHQSIAGLRSMVANYGLDPVVEKKLEPYVGQIGAAGDAYAKATGTFLSDQQKDNVNTAFRRAFSAEVEVKYDLGQTIQQGLNFSDLPSNTKTAIFDVYWQYGGPKTLSYNFWKQVTSGDWNGALSNLQNFGDPAHASRRLDDANLLLKDIQSHALPLPSHI